MRLSRRFISLVLTFAICLGMCVPAFAKDSSISESSLPPGVDETEAWFPANGVMLLEEANDACGITDHLPPSGYRYRGYSTGDSSVDADIVGGICTIVGFVPGFGTLSMAFSAMLLTVTMREYLLYGARLTTYNKYIWEKNGSYWYHVVWTADSDGDGVKEYITCVVETYP